MTTPTREQVIERSRIDFECYFLESRRSKGANRAPTFMRHEQDGTYIDDHTQRHWWTWQQAINAGREQGLREAKEVCECKALASALAHVNTDEQAFHIKAEAARSCAAAIEQLRGK